MSPAESYECPEKFNCSECRVNAIGNGKFFPKFSSSTAFWSRNYVSWRLGGFLVLDKWFHSSA